MASGVWGTKLKRLTEPPSELATVSDCQAALEVLVTPKPLKNQSFCRVTPLDELLTVIVAAAGARPVTSMFPAIARCVY